MKQEPRVRADVLTFVPGYACDGARATVSAAACGTYGVVALVPADARVGGLGKLDIVAVSHASFSPKFPENRAACRSRHREGDTGSGGRTRQAGAGAGENDSQRSDADVRAVQSELARSGCNGGASTPSLRALRSLVQAMTRRRWCNSRCVTAGAATSLFSMRWCGAGAACACGARSGKRPEIETKPQADCTDLSRNRRKHGTAGERGYAGRLLALDRHAHQHRGGAELKAHTRNIEICARPIDQAEKRLQKYTRITASSCTTSVQRRDGLPEGPAGLGKTAAPSRAARAQGATRRHRQGLAPAHSRHRSRTGHDRVTSRAAGRAAASGGVDR